MKRFTVILLILCLLTTGGAFVVSNDPEENPSTPPVNVKATVNVPSTYSTIQAAVNAVSSSGDTIMVAAGTYSENIVIPAGKSVDIIGAGSSSSIISGGNSGSTVTIKGDSCTLKGFKIKDSGMQAGDAGIFVDSDYNTIEECNITRNNAGIYCNESSFNTIKNNTIYNNYGVQSPGIPTVGHWKLDEASWSGTSGEVKDASGNGNHGTSISGASTVAGKYGRAGDFDQVGYVEVPDNDDIEGMSEITISGWFYAHKDPSTDEYYSLVAKCNYGGTISYGICLNGPSTPSWAQGIRFFLRTSSGDTTCNSGWSSRPSLNVWHHFSMTWKSGGGLKAYVDSTLVGTGTTRTGTVSTNGLPLRIGSSSGSSEDGFDGLIDDIRIFDKYLTKAEIDEIYRSDIPGGITLASSHNNTIANNTILKNSGDGISSFNSNDNSIRNNTFTHNYRSGLFLEKSHRADVSRNDVLSNHGSELVTDGLVGYWKMDEDSWSGAAGEVKDSTGNGLDGRAYGGTTTTSGKYGSAGDFDGSNDYLKVEDDPLLDLSKWTICVWVNYEDFSNTYMRIVDKRTDGSTDYYENFALQTDGAAGTIKHRFHTGAAISAQCQISISNLNPDTWYFFVGRYSGATISLDIYGKGSHWSDSKSESGTPYTTGTQRLSVGVKSAISNNDYFKGMIDDLMIYNRALTGEEVLQNYISGEKSGIYLKDSPGNDIHNNTIKRNKGHAIGLNNSNGNEIHRNNNQKNNGTGFFLGGSDSNWIHNNSISSNDCIDQRTKAGLVGYWKMDETSWTGAVNEIKDASGNSNHGKSLNGLNVKTGRFNNAGDFDGSNDYIELSNEQNFDLTSNFYIGTWIKHTSSTYSAAKCIISKTNLGGNSQQTYYIGIMTDGKLRARIGSGASDNLVTSPSAIPSGQWVHIAFMVSDDYLYLYVNSKEVAKSAKTITVQTNNVPVRIGWNPNFATGYCFDGLMDEFVVYNRVLSQEEIWYHFKNGITAQIHLIDSSSNIITENMVNAGGSFAVRATTSSTGNDIESNHFLNNNKGFPQASDDGSGNSWDDGVKGNYWSDHQSPDAMTPFGIVDNPYPLQGTASAQDDYPVCLSIRPPANLNANEDSYFQESAIFHPGYLTQPLSIEHNAPWMSTDPDGTIYGTPLNSHVGQYWVNASVWDYSGQAFTNFTITVINTNDAPTIDTTDINTATEDVLYAVEYTATDIDPTGDTMLWMFWSNAQFLDIDMMSGNLSGLPTNSDVGSYWVNVTVSDQKGGTDFHNFTLTVVNVNDDPVISTVPPTSVLEDQLYAVDFAALDVDPPGDALTWSVHTNAGFLTMNTATGNLSGTPLNADVGTYFVNVTVDDGNSGSDWLNYSLEVINVNDIPVWKDLPTDKKLILLENYTFDVNATDEDGDTLTYFLISDPASKVKINSGSGLITWAPEALGLFEMNISASDGEFNIFHLFYLNVTLPVQTTLRSPDNGAEVKAANPTLEWTISGNQGYDVFYDIYFSDVKIDVQGQVLSSRIAKGVSANTFTFPSELEKNKTYYWTVVPKVNEEYGTCASGVWSFTISEEATVNALPVFESDPVITAGVGVEWSYKPIVTDPDNDTITILLVDGPDGVTFINNVLKWTPTAGQLGDNVFELEASDGKASVSQNFKVVVTQGAPVNNPPAVTDIPAGTVAEGEEFRYQIQAEDLDNDILTYEFVASPEGMTIDSSGLIVWQTEKGDAGTYNIIIRVNDGEDNVTEDFTLTVDEKTDTAGGGLGWMLFLIIGVIAIILIILIVLAVIFLRKREESDEDAVDEDDPGVLVPEAETVVKTGWTGVVKDPDGRKGKAVKDDDDDEDEEPVEPASPDAQLAGEIPEDQSLLPGATIEDVDMDSIDLEAEMDIDSVPATPEDEIGGGMPGDDPGPEEVPPDMAQFMASEADKQDPGVYHSESSGVWSPEMVEARTASESKSAIESIKELKELKDAGAITEEEYEVSKRRLLRKI